MAKDMEFLQSPEENLGTWDTLMKLIWISAGSIAILLLLLAWAFV